MTNLFCPRRNTKQNTIKPTTSFHITIPKLNPSKQTQNPAAYREREPEPIRSKAVMTLMVSSLFSSFQLSFAFSCHYWIWGVFLYVSYGWRELTCAELRIGVYNLNPNMGFYIFHSKLQLGLGSCFCLWRGCWFFVCLGW